MHAPWRRAQYGRLAATLLAVMLCSALGAAAAERDAPLGIRVFSNPRHPPTYQGLSGPMQRQQTLGLAVFNTQFVPAGTPGAERIDGLGPLFNAASCDECHNDAAHGRGPTGDGAAPVALIVQLEPAASPGVELTGDPRYGHVLSTASIDGLLPEGDVSVHYATHRGQYPDGTAWQLREPRYELSGLRYGPLAASTVVRPRIAPALFGDGLLQAVPSEAILQGAYGQAALGVPAWQWIGGHRVLGRFGWQGNALSIRDQTTRALAREMGLTTRDVPHDDCTSVQTDCLSQRSGGYPEISDELLDALVHFVQGLAVPAADPSAQASPGDAIFEAIGCAACHRPRLPVMLSDAAGRPVHANIAAYTDLRLHDLGSALADRYLSGRTVPSRWRTAPLWGEGYRLRRERSPTFLHDGRARSLEEAVLWHDGEASGAQQAFQRLPRAQRMALLQWLATR
jgi:CxxC motif-containing protein (DUF1111 family)